MWNASYVQKHFSKPDRWKLDDSKWKLILGCLSLSLLKAPTGSDAAHLDCENRTGKGGKTKLCEMDMPVLGLAGSHWGENLSLGDLEAPGCSLARCFDSTMMHKTSFSTELALFTMPILRFGCFFCFVFGFCFCVACVLLLFGCWLVLLFWFFIMALWLPYRTV